ncbi:hypothetical protein [Thermococcus gorgonarius]|uniref:Uncharacterized protein n=1 Tax=Thermococcus gorgonarius TaxID=71997 RepID=A0A2Z2M8N9_THEGO|nr:hypothetical protein [Thermococcus gorgonarius]ASJ01713.1 hypothetical protein A3K92_04865 [Thermococcus gorgonarius]
MEDESSSSSWFSRIFGSRSKNGALLEQELSGRAYEDYRRLLLKARPEVSQDRIVVKLPEGEVELRKDRLIVRAKDRKTAEKILRNLHHYDQPPSLWPAYGLSYSIKQRTRPRIRA